MYLLAKFQFHILKVLEVTALKSTSNRNIDLYSKYRKAMKSWDLMLPKTKNRIERELNSLKSTIKKALPHLIWDHLSCVIKELHLPVTLPLVISKCCRSVISCEQCVQHVLASQDTTSCPLCRDTNFETAQKDFDDNTPTSPLCLRRFTEDCYVIEGQRYHDECGIPAQKCLKTDAVPTIFLGGFAHEASVFYKRLACLLSTK